MFKIQRKKNQNLVISAVSDTSLHRKWSESKDFDSLLIYFGDKEGFEKESTFYKRAKGYKYHLIQDVLEEMPELFEYEYIWLPDDDIAAHPSDVCKLFSLMNKYNLQIAQPSIMGYYGANITLHQKGSKIRFTNWVEIMCPCFSSSALKICKSCFKENNCGWALENIWNHLLGHPKDKIAIIDDIIVIHTRPVLTGDTYKGKQSPLNWAISEMKKVHEKWDIQNKKIEDNKYGKTIEGEVFATLYHQEFKEMEKGINKKERCWPESELIKELINKASHCP